VERIGQINKVDLNEINEKLRIIQRIVNTKDRYVSNGIIREEHFTISDFVTDSTWRRLSLANIIPPNTKIVFIRVSISSNTANKSVYLRQPGSGINRNSSAVGIQVANIPIEDTLAVSCNSNREIEYYITTGATWSFINFYIKGWITGE